MTLERRKPKNPQKQNLTEVDGRDTFQTPNYATDIIVPFLQSAASVRPFFRIWECAAGLGKMVRRLESYGFDVFGTDLQHNPPINFISDPAPTHFDCIVTNTPFSLKQKFFMKCLEYNRPFALLVPAEYAIWVIDTVHEYGCEKVIPRRRIDYITPNILWRIHEGEIWELSKESYSEFEKLSDFKEQCPELWKKELDMHPGYCLWDSIYDAPAKLLRKYSSSYYHSMWLTRGFNIGRTETFVELTNEEKDNI